MPPREREVARDAPRRDEEQQHEQGEGDPAAPVPFLRAALRVGRCLPACRPCSRRSGAGAEPGPSPFRLDRGDRASLRPPFEGGMVAAPCGRTGSSGSTSEGRRSLPGSSSETARSAGRRRSRHRTASEEAVLDALDGLVRDVLDEGVAAIGYGVPCNLDRETGRALRATNLPIEDVDFVARGRSRFGLPVGVENDANAAALAEWKLGSGRGAVQPGDADARDGGGRRPRPRRSPLPRLGGARTRRRRRGRPSLSGQLPRARATSRRSRRVRRPTGLRRSSGEAMPTRIGSSRRRRRATQRPWRLSRGSGTTSARRSARS